MTGLIVTAAIGFMFAANYWTLPNWLLAAVSFSLIALFTIYGREPKHDHA